jgi:hypothetical protein
MHDCEAVAVESGHGTLFARISSNISRRILPA